MAQPANLLNKVRLVQQQVRDVAEFVQDARLLRVEQAEISLADVLRVLEYRDGLGVQAVHPVDAREIEIGIDQQW